MRTGPAVSTLETAASWYPQVSSWLGGTVLADVVPVTGGRVTWSTTKQVPDSLRITVARTSVEDGVTVDWLPQSADAPLARFGQILDVSVIVAGVPVRFGRFLITGWSESGGDISVDAEGLLQAAADDRLTSPTSPRDDGTLQSEFSRLLPSYLNVQFDDALANRACPKTMEWDENRLDALYEIADAWPARIRMDAWGQVQVRPALPADATPVLTLTDGEGGTVVSAPVQDSRAQRYNMVVARSSADGVDAQAIASVLSGPMVPTGDYRPVPKFFSSPLLLTEEQCLSAALAQLADALRPSSTIKVEMAPDPRIELDDAVEVITAQPLFTDSRQWGFVTGVDMPLTVSDGAMRLDIAIF